MGTEGQIENMNVFHIERGFTHGLTRWSSNSSSNNRTIPSLFEMSIDISNYSSGDLVAVYAMAIVDQDWAYQPNNNTTTKIMTPVVQPKHTPSMSHVVNARTNPQWRHTSAGKIIQGRKKWFSIPLTLEINNRYDSIMDLSNRMVEVDLPSVITINNTSDERSKFSTVISINGDLSNVTLKTSNNTYSNNINSHDNTDWKKLSPFIHFPTLIICLVVFIFVITFFHYRWKIINKVISWNRKRRERMFYQHYCQKYPYHKFGLELEAEDGDENMDLSIFGMNFRSNIKNAETMELS